ncbi:hypothetical protein N9248_00905 [bacterium]|nr:hypothetical protein [bacterium]
MCSGIACLILAICTRTAVADIPPNTANLALAGDSALQTNDNDLAIKNYTAVSQPGDETIYNLGIAHYRNGDLALAADQFRQVIGAQNDSVAARARFNLGNTFYSQALNELTPPAKEVQTQTGSPAPQQDIEAGTNLLKSAITQYRSSLRINGKDNDARANIELAQSLIDQLQQQQDQEQQDQEQQDQEQQDQEQQDQEQQDQEQQDQEQQDQQQQDQQQQDQQQQDQQQQDQQQQDQQQQDQQQQNQQQQDQQPSDDENSNPPEDQNDESSTKPSGELTAVNEENDSSTQEAAEPIGVASDQMTEEEARKLLQSIRDRDMLRRLRKQAAERALRVPVERDW